MRLITILSLLMLSMSAWAGTFKDDFEDGNWGGWETVKADPWDTNVEDGISIAEGVLTMDSTDKPERYLVLSMIKDWKDYSFSADMLIVEIEPGAE